MSKGILGRKVGMTQVYDDTGCVVPVTVIEAGPCHVLQLRTKDRDGYEAVQLGFLDRPRNSASRADRGRVGGLASKRSKRLAASGVDLLSKPDCEPKEFVREFRGSIEGFEVGQVITAESFADVVAVDVVAASKGRGFAGVMKRHNFSGQRATHGVKKVHRHAGGTGCSAYPSRTFKGRRMAGRYGGRQITVRNMRIQKLEGDSGLLLVRGGVPGPNGGFVVVRPANMLR